jgi:hypothetical protein
MKNGHAIIDCKCENEYQDQTYGVGKRVANATAKQDTKPETYVEVRCTVCSRTQRVKPSQIKK